MDQNDLFLSRLDDSVRRCKFGNTVYLGFLDEREHTVAKAYLKNRKDVTAVFWGGVPDAQRVFLGLTTDLSISTDEFPIYAVTFRFNKKFKLTHRDFLGSIMALNFTRDVIGDICIDEGLAVVFVKEEIAYLLAQELNKIGKVGVDSEVGIPAVIPPSFRLLSCSGVVASMRLDCVISLLTGKGRKDSAEFIRNGLCMVNHITDKSVSDSVQSDDVISIRGFGKYKILECDSVTKKGRIRVVYGKFA